MKFSSASSLILVSRCKIYLSGERYKKIICKEEARQIPKYNQIIDVQSCLLLGVWRSGLYQLVSPTSGHQYSYLCGVCCGVWDSLAHFLSVCLHATTSRGQHLIYNTFFAAHMYCEKGMQEGLSVLLRENRSISRPTNQSIDQSIFCMR